MKAPHPPILHRAGSRAAHDQIQVCAIFQWVLPGRPAIGQVCRSAPCSVRPRPNLRPSIPSKAGTRDSFPREISGEFEGKTRLAHPAPHCTESYARAGGAGAGSGGGDSLRPPVSAPTPPLPPLTLTPQLGRPRAPSGSPLALPWPEHGPGTGSARA